MLQIIISPDITIIVNLIKSNSNHIEDNNKIKEDIQTKEEIKEYSRRWEIREARAKVDNNMITNWTMNLEIRIDNNAIRGINSNTLLKDKQIINQISKDRINNKLIEEKTKVKVMDITLIETGMLIGQEFLREI